MIPKILSRVWLGDAYAIPPAFEAYWESLRRMLPGWELRTLTTAPAVCVTGDLIDRCTSLAAAADICRLEWLAITGGIVVHADVEGVGDGPPPWCDWFACWSCKASSGDGNYAIGAVPNADPIAAALKTMQQRRKWIAGVPYQHTASETGPERLGRAIHTVGNGTMIGFDAASQWFRHHRSLSWLPDAEARAAGYAGTQEAIDAIIAMRQGGCCAAPVGEVEVTP